jgi:hypothetical protein
MARMRLVDYSLLLLFLGPALTTVGCSTEPQSRSHSRPDAQGTGFLAVTLEIGGGNEIDTVSWKITGGEMEPMSGTIDTSAPGTTASIEVFGLPPTEGDDYTISMEASTNDGALTCAGSADFGIEAAQKTALMVFLNCKPPERFGSVRVNGKFNICAELTKAVASPLQTSVGSEIDLFAQAEDAEGDDIDFLWTAEGGIVDENTAQETTFTCLDLGLGSVTITVSDGDIACASSWTVPVTCVPSDGGAGGAGGEGGEGGAGGEGGMAGTGGAGGEGGMAGTGGSGGTLSSKDECTPEPNAAVVCGSVVAADGETPIAGAEVRLDDGSEPNEPDPDGCLTGATGEFGCIVPAENAGMTNFIVVAPPPFENQEFTAEVSVGTASDAGDIPLGGGGEEPPLFWVVVPGLYDGVQVLLSQLVGCTLSNVGGDPAQTRGSEDCFNKGLLVLDDSDPSSALYVPSFLASDALEDYEALFINCEANWSSSPGVNAAIQSFSGAGKDLYFSDLSDTWLTSVFPGAINFGGNQTMSGPPIEGDVLDPGLAAVVGTPIELFFDLGIWTVMSSVEPFVTTYIEGDVTSLSPAVPGIRPITVGWKPAETSGCIFYTSYHVEGASTGAAQELAIKYLVQNADEVCDFQGVAD